MMTGTTTLNQPLDHLDAPHSQPKKEHGEGSRRKEHGQNRLTEPV
jgi:hypothetical protein